jgi:hypothetical protein
MNQLNLALVIRLSREELDNAIEMFYFSGYYFYLKQPKFYYKLLLYTIAEVMQLITDRVPYSSLELRLKIEKYIARGIKCLLQENLTQLEKQIEQLNLASYCVT